MSVRQIPKNYRNVTGRASSQKTKAGFFESTLERDLLTLFEFDKNVISFDVQPVSIQWIDSERKHRTYIPDVLVQYRSGFCPFSPRDTILCEVKYRDDIRKNWEVLKPKFRAAIRYANKMGWRFKLMTEREIRTIYMENARFLLPYLHRESDEQYAELLVKHLRSMSFCTIEELIKAIFFDKWSQAELIPTLWNMIAAGEIRTDLNIPLTMSASIWLEG